MICGFCPIARIAASAKMIVDCAEILFSSEIPFPRHGQAHDWATLLSIPAAGFLVALDRD
jgi:hypothetical protein